MMKNIAGLKETVIENLSKLAERLFRGESIEDGSIDAQALMQEISLLTEREQLVLKRRYDLDGTQGKFWTRKKISEEIGVSVESVRQTELKSYRKLKRSVVRKNYDMVLKAEAVAKVDRAKAAIEPGDELVSIDTLRLNPATKKMLKSMKVETVAEFKTIIIEDLDTSYPSFCRRLWEIKRERACLGAPLE